MTGILRYEWRRISTIRSTWIMAGASVLVTLLLGLLMILILKAAEQAARDASQPLEVTSLGAIAVGCVALNPVVWVLIATIAAQAFGQEYRHGTLRLTLTAFPVRPPVFIGKIIISMLVITAVIALSVIIVALVIGVGAGSVVKPEDSIVDLLLIAVRCWVFLIGLCLMATAITIITRVVALGIVIPLLLIGIEVVFVNALVAFVGDAISWLPQLLPLAAGMAFIFGENMVSGGLIFACWVVIPLVVGFVLFQARDA